MVDAYGKIENLNRYRNKRNAHVNMWIKIQIEKVEKNESTFFSPGK